MKFWDKKEFHVCNWKKQIQIHQQMWTCSSVPSLKTLLFSKFEFKNLDVHYAMILNSNTSKFQANILMPTQSGDALVNFEDVWDST